jgi:hypothetical protein
MYRQAEGRELREPPSCLWDGRGLGAERTIESGVYADSSPDANRLRQPCALGVRGSSERSEQQWAMQIQAGLGAHVLNAPATLGP